MFWLNKDIHSLWIKKKKIKTIANNDDICIYKLSDITNYNANVRVDTLSSDIAKYNFYQFNLRCANFRNIKILLKLFVSYFLYSSHRK